MKEFFTFFFACLYLGAFSQTSILYPKSKVILGEENVMVYEPLAGITIPEGAQAKYVFIDGYKTSPLNKIKNKFEFKVKVPDSIRTIIVSVFDKKGNLIDNNFDRGFVLKLNNSEPVKADLDKIKLTHLNGQYFFKLKNSPEKLVEDYENIFRKSPELKEDSFTFYSFYNLLSTVDPEKAKLEATLMAKKLEKKKNENNLIAAENFYTNLLNDFEKGDSLSASILKQYPTGLFAKSKLTQKFFKEANDPTQKADLNVLMQYYSDYTSNYPKEQHDDQITDMMNAVLFKNVIDTKDWARIDDFAKRFNNPMFAAQQYNLSSWEFADGDNITSEGKELNFAEKLATNSLEILETKRNNLGKYEEKSDYDKTLMYYTDALALVLYKQGKYDQAFMEMSKIIDFPFLEDSNRERYILYAENAKGENFVKNYLDNLLKEQNISDKLFDKLATIYRSQNLSLAEIENLRLANKKIATKESREKLMKMYSGDLKAKDFELNNLKGEKVKLSSLKGKIVVLDFWATWCGPCREALPHMQELVKKYDKSEVVFLFVNTMETKKPTEIIKSVNKFITENKYDDLNIVFDLDNDVYKKYLVQGLPTEIIIDKEGNLLSYNIGYDGNLEALINENK